MKTNFTQYTTVKRKDLQNHNQAEQYQNYMLLLQLYTLNKKEMLMAKELKFERALISESVIQKHVTPLAFFAQLKNIFNNTLLPKISWVYSVPE